MFWLEKADRVRLVKLIRCGFSVAFSGQVEEMLGLRNLGTLLTAYFEPFVNLLAILISTFSYGRNETSTYVGSPLVRNRLNLRQVVSLFSIFVCGIGRPYLKKV